MTKLDWFSLSLIALVGYSLMSFLIVVMAKKGYPVSFILLGVGVAFLIYYSLQTFVFSHAVLHVTPLGIMIILVIGLLSAFANLVAYQASAVAPNAGLVLAISTGMQSVVVAILAVIFLKDNMTVLQTWGIIFAVISIFFISLGSRQSNKTVSTGKTVKTVQTTSVKK